MDNQMALIYGSLSISWFAVFVTIGCFAGFAIACVLRKIQQKPVSDVFIAVTFAVPFALIFARIQYCVFSGDNFNNLFEMLNVSNGGYGLYGAILGVVAAVFVANALFKTDGIGSLMDCVALGGAFAVTVGRFATGFTGSEIGYEVGFKVFAVYDADENLYNLAVYMLDGIVEAVVFAACLFFFIISLKGANKEIAGGKTALLVFALHGTNQVVMDSMRADALKLGANDFIKVSQILGILSCMAVIVYFMVLSVKKNSFKKYHAVSIVIILVCIVLGILSEYRVGNGNYITKHLLMFVCMVVLAALTMRFGFCLVNPVKRISSRDKIAGLNKEIESLNDEITSLKDQIDSLNGELLKSINQGASETNVSDDETVTSVGE